jgi:hypothetical protein
MRVGAGRLIGLISTSITPSQNDNLPQPDERQQCAFLDEDMANDDKSDLVLIRN